MIVHRKADRCWNLACLCAVSIGLTFVAATLHAIDDVSSTAKRAMESSDSSIESRYKQAIESEILPVAVLQETQPRLPQQAATVPLSGSDNPLSRRLLEVAPNFGEPLSASGLNALGYGRDRTDLSLAMSTSSTVQVNEATKPTTDVGSLLSTSPTALGVTVQKRSKMVSDPRIRGSRIGKLSASGSYWYPARIDLDTAVSRIDSELVDEVVTFNGPYTVEHGPGFRHLVFEFKPAPHHSAAHVEGTTGIDFGSNGNQTALKQSIAMGNERWGAKLSYRDRFAESYVAGNGVEVPSGYHSREFDLAVGRYFSNESDIQFNALRLDQTDVELPGQAFDIDYLVTDGYEVKLTSQEFDYCDTFEVESWINRTRLNGNAQSPSKRRQFPIFDIFAFTGVTDVDALSTGYKFTNRWRSSDQWQFSVGTDLRFQEQELNEVTSGAFQFVQWQNANSPIPESYQINPGVYADYQEAITEDVRIKLGVRGDSVHSEIIDDPNKLMNVTSRQVGLADVYGTNDFHQSFGLLSGYINGELDLTDHTILSLGCGYSETAPTLTEMYAAEPFMFVLQNGLNTVTGDPRLESEKLVQLDVALRQQHDDYRWGIKGFYGLAHDYITFERIRQDIAGQTQLKYVNTDLARLTGFESYVSVDTLSWLSPFVTVSYTTGKDLTRNGRFATIAANRFFNVVTPSTRDANQVRGGGNAGSAEEWLPGIAPLDARVGVALHTPSRRTPGELEVSARIVDNQTRVASSLNETPTPSFAVWDLRYSYQSTKGWRIGLGIENLFDRTYREHLDFRGFGPLAGLQMYQPGINIYLTSSVTY